MMTQENIAIVSSLVASLTAVATLITAIATIITARQIKKQREASYRPELAFSKTRVYAYGSHGDGRIPTRWSEKEITDYKAINGLMCWTMAYKLRLYNIGFGTAKNIEVSWDFDVSEMVKRVNILAQRSLQPAYHKYENGILSLESTKFHETHQLWRNQRRGEWIGYLLPANIAKEGVELEVPITFIHLSSYLFYFGLCAEKASPVDIFDVPPLIINLRFEDIAGETHNISYDLHLTVAMASFPSEGMDFQGDITPTRRQGMNIGFWRSVVHAVVSQFFITKRAFLRPKRHTED